MKTLMSTLTLTLSQSWARGVRFAHRLISTLTLTLSQSWARGVRFAHRLGGRLALPKIALPKIALPFITGALCATCFIFGVAAGSETDRLGAMGDLIAEKFMPRTGTYKGETIAASGTWQNADGSLLIDWDRGRITVRDINLGLHTVNTLEELKAETIDKDVSIWRPGGGVIVTP